MFEISKDFEFSASHRLDHLASGHKCHRLHGHNYVVRLSLAADDLDGDGFVTDYGVLDQVKRWIDDRIDHRHLNEVLGSGVATTAENIARFIFTTWKAELPQLVAVSVSETPRTWAIYKPSP